LQQPFCRINRLVQLLNCIAVLRPLQGQWLTRKYLVLANGVNQIGECGLAILESFSNAVFYQPTLKINRLLGGGGIPIAAASLSSHLIS